MGLTKIETVVLGAIAFFTAAAGVAHYRELTRARRLRARDPRARRARVDRLVLDGAARRAARPAATGVLQSTLGNLPEFFVVIFALSAGKTVVAQTAIVGSVLANALLVLGLTIVAGAWVAKDERMRFNARLPNDTATLLQLARLHHRPRRARARARRTAGARKSPRRRLDGRRDLPAPRLRARGSSRTCAPASARERDHTATSRMRCRRAIGLLARRRHRLGVRLGLVRRRADACDGQARPLRGVRGSRHRRDRRATRWRTSPASCWRRRDRAISPSRSSRTPWPRSRRSSSRSSSSCRSSSQRSSRSRCRAAAGALVLTALAVWQITGDGEATLFEGLALVAFYVIIATITLFAD